MRGFVVVAVVVDVDDVVGVDDNERRDDKGEVRMGDLLLLWTTVGEETGGGGGGGNIAKRG